MQTARGRVRVDERLAMARQKGTKHSPEVLDRIYEPVRERLEVVTEHLSALSRSQSPFLAELLGHVLENKGKRIRPALVLLASDFHPNDGRKAEIMATAVEISGDLYRLAVFKICMASSAAGVMMTAVSMSSV